MPDASPMDPAVVRRRVFEIKRKAFNDGSLSLADACYLIDELRYTLKELSDCQELLRTALADCHVWQTAEADAMALILSHEGHIAKIEDHLRTALAELETRTNVYKEVMGRMHDACHRHKLGLGGEHVDRLVIEALDAALADTRRVDTDAARYRWLRNPAINVGLVLDKVTGEVPAAEGMGGGAYKTYEYRSGEELDKAIDAAMAATPREN